MGSYLEQFDATPLAGRWPLVRGWIFGEPLPFFSELRADRPILVMPELTLATRFVDCTEILRRHDLFSVALYKPKQSSYWMDEDDTAAHWREKSIMMSILDREDVPAIRTFVGTKAAGLLTAANGSMEAVAGLTRAVPLALVQEWFGLTDIDPAKLCQWSYWNQINTFWNQPFDAIAWPDPGKIVVECDLSNVEMVAYIAALLAAREAEIKLGCDKTDPVTRLLKLWSSDALDNFDLIRVGINVSGLLIGAVETTSHAVVNVLDFLMSRPDDLAKARIAARSDDPGAVDGFVFEALRFRPAFPYFFRTCEDDAVLGRNTAYATTLPKGTTVLAVTHSAMFDPAAFADPETVDPGRGLGNQFHFGIGLHECLGRQIARVMVPEIVRRSLRLDGLTVGPVDRQAGPVPETWQWTWH